LVVVYGFVDSHKDMNINKFRIPTTKHFFKGGKVWNIRSCKVCNLLMMNVEKQGTKIMKWGRSQLAFA